MNENEMISPAAAEYAERLSSSTDALLQEIETFTQTNYAHAHMLSGPLQGRVLEMLSKIQAPETILEIGTFTGYSALCLAKGLKKGGQLHTIELREEDAATAKGYFNRSEYADQIHLHVGDATDILQDLNFKWNLIFIDADKVNYIRYYELTLPLLADNGLIIVDNVLFHGQVLHEVVRGRNAKAIDEFNRHVAADNRVEQVILTVRDGLMLIRKK